MKKSFFLFNREKELLTHSFLSGISMGRFYKQLILQPVYSTCVNVSVSKHKNEHKYINKTNRPQPTFVNFFLSTDLSSLPDLRIRNSYCS